jgi:hypothetical protein
MVVQFVREDGGGRIGGRTDRAARTYKRRFTVETDDPTDGPEIVLEAEGIPQRLDSYLPASGIVEGGTYCQVVDCNLKGASRTIWEVVAYYTNDLQPYNVDNPLERPAEVAFDTTTYSVPVIQDALDSSAIRNSAGDPFDPVPEEEESRLVIMITVNRASYDPRFYINFHNKLNNAEYIIPYRSDDGVEEMTFKRRELKCKKIRGLRQILNGVYYWATTFTFETKPERIPDGARILIDGGPAKGGTFTEPMENDTLSYCWTRFLLDRGVRGYTVSIPPYAPILTQLRDKTTGQPYTKPPLLDGAGNQLPFSGDPVYIGYDLLFEKDFTLLGNMNP